MLMVALLAASTTVAAQDGTSPGGDGAADGDEPSRGTADNSTAEPNSGNATSADGTDEDAKTWCEKHPAECREWLHKCQSTDDPAERQRCHEAFCRAKPQHESCRSMGATRGNGTTGEARPNSGAQSPLRPLSPAARCAVNPDASPAVCSRIADHRKAASGLEWISYNVSATGLGLTDLRLRGHLVAEALHVVPEAPWAEPPRIIKDDKGHRLLVQFDGGTMLLHDHAKGFLQFRGPASDLHVVLPTDADVTAWAGGYRLNLDGAGVLVFTGRDLQLEGQLLTAPTFVALHVEPAKPEPAPGGHPDSAPAIQQAIARQHVGAQVSVKGADHPLPRTADDRARDAVATGASAGGVVDLETDSNPVQVLVYDDVNITVEVPKAKPDPGKPLRVVVSAELDSGRTIVLDLDHALFNGQALELRYFDVNDDGTETEVVFREADGGLQDILDPTDDAGQPEYWMVRDANGIQLMASIPHWSTHAITIAGLGELYKEHPVLIGMLAGAAASVAAAAGLFWPRRPEDDE